MLSINQLHKEIQQREDRKVKTYQKILEKIYMRILLINQKSIDCYTFYVIPTFMYGIPLYDVSSCIIYAMNDLTRRCFKVIYTHPNLLYIETFLLVLGLIIYERNFISQG